MFISKKSLNKAKPEFILRLANWLGIVTHKRELPDIIEETHIKINWG